MKNTNIEDTYIFKLSIVRFFNIKNDFKIKNLVQNIF